MARVRRGRMVESCILDEDGLLAAVGEVLERKI